MRFFYFLVLLILAGILGLFIYQNEGEVTVQFWNAKITAPLAQLVGVVYVLGMLTGWTVVGIFRRTLREVAHDARQEVRAY